MLCKYMLIASVVIVVTADDNLKTAECVGVNEIWKECGPSCQATCDKFEENVGCLRDQCVPSCVCSSGTVRNRWGNCIPIENCKLEKRIFMQKYPEYSRLIPRTKSIKEKELQTLQKKL